VWQWLKRLDPTPPPLQPRHFSADYKAYTVSNDEVITSRDLIKRWETMLPGSTVKADKTWRVIKDTLGDTRATLLTRANLDAEELTREALESAHVPLSVTVLVDHSGSMRDENTNFAVLIAEATDLISRKLDLPCEILGFTTCEWKGAPVRDQWPKRGRPPLPGRLCALRHIFYDSFPDREGVDLRAMFLPGVLKENVDGEALLWAAERARKAPGKRHLILMVSDGAPVDDSTLSVNPLNILVDHLKAVVSELDQDESIHLAAVGLNYDVDRFYDHNITLKFYGDVERSFLPFLAIQIRASRAI